MAPLFESKEETAIVRSIAAGSGGKRRAPRTEGATEAAFPGVQFVSSELARNFIMSVTSFALRNYCRRKSDPLLLSTILSRMGRQPGRDYLQVRRPALVSGASHF